MVRKVVQFQSLFVALCLVAFAGGCSNVKRVLPRPADLSVVVQAKPAQELTEVVVWVDSSERSTVVGSSSDITVDVANPNPKLIVAAPDAIWDFLNTTGQTVSVFLRDEQGKMLPLGRVVPPGSSLVPVVRGYVDVMVQGKDQPVARVFVAPSSFVQLTTSNKAVSFVAIPAGAAKVNAWHAHWPVATADLDLDPGSSQQVSVTLSAPAR